MPAVFVHEAAGTDERTVLSAFLADALDGGPVCYDSGGRRFYALTPGSTSRIWKVPDAECLGSDTFLGLPSTDLTVPDPHEPPTGACRMADGSSPRRRPTS